jgi:hypothetical protein
MLKVEKTCPCGNARRIYFFSMSTGARKAPALISMKTALSGNDFEVGEISALSAAAPEADQPFLAVAQLSDD